MSVRTELNSGVMLAHSSLVGEMSSGVVGGLRQKLLVEIRVDLNPDVTLAGATGIEAGGSREQDLGGARPAFQLIWEISGKKYNDK